MGHSCFWKPGQDNLLRNRRRLLIGSSVGLGSEIGCKPVERDSRGRGTGLITNRNRRPQKRKTGFLSSTRLGMRFRNPAGSLGAGCIGSRHRIG
jgi:hypothetical protein